MADFSVDFWVLAEETGWEEKVLPGAFLNSLNEEFKCELATKEMPKSLDAFIAMCVRADDHMHEYGKWTGGPRQAGRSSSPWKGSLSADRR